jgi:hypothetical protein
MFVVGFIPLYVDTVSDVYFFLKAVYYQDWESAAFFGVCALLPFGASYFKSGGKWVAKSFGVKWLDDLVTIGKKTPDPPTSPVVRNADEAYDALRRSGADRVTLEAGEDIPVFRVYGGTSPLGGRSWTLVDPRAFSQNSYRIKAGLPDTNAASMLAEGFIKKGTVFDLYRSSGIASRRLGMILPGGMPEVHRSAVLITKSNMPIFWSGTL